MKTDWTNVEPFRLRDGRMASSTGDTFGFFVFPGKNVQVRAMAVDGTETGWEHVSVSVMTNQSGKCRMPTWDEMCMVKALFWDDEETVIQLHPPKSEWVNNHAGCLHLWRCTNQEQPLPPSIFVGIKELGTLTKL